MKCLTPDECVAMTDAVNRRARQRRAFWTRQLHQWHWISSALSLVGMLLFVWIIGKMMFVSFQNSDNANNLRFLSLGLLSAMVVILIHGLVDVPYFKNDLAVMFWLLIASISMINNFQINNISYENCNRP